MNMTAADFLNTAGTGERYPGFKLGKIGDFIEGELVEEPRVVPTTDDKGNTVNKLVLAVKAVKGQSHDPRTKEPIDVPAGEVFSLWVKGGFGAGALKQALADAGKQSLEAGATLTFAYVEDKPTGKPQPAKVYKAKYLPPSGGVNLDDIF